MVLALAQPLAAFSQPAEAIAADDETAAVTTSTDESEDDVSQLGAVTVTAQQREESIQEVPISINVFSARDARELNAFDINDLGQYTPGLETNNLTVTQPRYTIRGITTNDFGIGSDPAVGVYIDGVYVGRSGAAQLNFNDIERVEILKGPQGTLFGRNAAAGAIHVVTQQPQAGAEGNLRYQYGNFDRHRAEGLFNTSLSDQLYARGSFVINQRDGWIDNNLGPDLDDEDQFSLRLGLLWDISANTDVRLSLDYDEISQDAQQGASLNAGIAPADPFGAFETDLDSDESRDVFGASLTVTSRWDEMYFTSISAYREFESNNLQDEDGSADPRFFFATENIEDQQQFSQEFRLQSDNRGPLRWTVGASYFYEEGEQRSDVMVTTNSLDTFFLFSNGVPAEQIPQVPLGAGLNGFFLSAFGPALEQISLASGIPVENIAAAMVQANLGRDWLEQTSNALEARSYAIYGDLTYALTERLDLTLGLRYTYDEKDFSIFSAYQNNIVIPVPGVDPVPFGIIFFDQFAPAEAQSDDWDALTPRVVLEYEWQDNVMTYASFTEGFKAGGFNSLGVDPPFDPEQVLNFELGMKSTWLGGRLLFNSAIFYYDYDDLQVLKLSGPPGVIPTFNVRNADAEGKGVELELALQPLDGLTLSASYGYLDTEITEYNLFPGETAADDLTGQPLSSMPEHMFNLTARYSWYLGDGSELRLRGDYSYTGDRVDNSGLNPGRGIDSYDLVNLRLSWLSADYHWELAAFVTNLFDEEYLFSIGGQGEALGSPVARRGYPRFYGIDLSYSF
ncbi:MAG: TonB-dependent receptor [Wenzhouxiangellaceae bacterium]